LSRSFCTQPWTSFGVRTYGGMSICPHMNYLANNDNIADISPQDFRMSSHVVEIRQDMLDGKSVEACNGCSYRDMYNQKNRDLKETILKNQEILPQKLTSLRLDLGNNCNLMCPTCGIHGSSNWEKIIRSVISKQFINMKFDWAQKLNWEENPYNLLCEVEELTFSGGEPFLIDECTQILKTLIKMGRASQISLYYITNGTIVPDKFVQIWSQFKSVTIFLSIDAIENRYEFLRNPAKWSEVKKNIDAFLKLPSQIQINFSQSISIFNFFHLIEYSEWLEETKKAYPERKILLHANPIMNPEYLTIASFSSAKKKEAKSWLENNKHKILNVDVSSLRKYLLESLPLSDQEIFNNRQVFLKTFLSNTTFNVAEIFPELSATEL
jgi:organic radical activating enzyme